MRITRKIRPAADVSERRDQDTGPPWFVRLGTLSELVEGGSGVKMDAGHVNGRM